MEGDAVVPGALFMVRKMKNPASAARPKTSAGCFRVKSEAVRVR